MDAVGTHEFAAIEAVEHVHFVFLLVAFDVGLLETASDGAVVVGDGEAYERAVGQVDGALHKSFGKGATTYNQSAVIVL